MSALMSTNGFLMTPVCRFHLVFNSLGGKLRKTRIDSPKIGHSTILYFSLNRVVNDYILIDPHGVLSSNVTGP